MGRLLSLVFLLPALLAAPSFAGESTTRLAAIANKVTHVVGRGDSLAAILARHGVDAGEVQRWWRAARPTRDLSKLAVGQKLELSFSEENQLVRLGYQIGDSERLIVERESPDGFRTRLEEPNVVVAPVGARGTVDTSFYDAARDAGIPESVISEMVDLLSVRIDFGSRVRPGDRFRVLYEGRHDENGRRLRPGRVLVAEYQGARQSVSAFLYEDSQGRTAYVDGSGRTLDDSLLRYPLKFTRITSTFSYSRFHPILKKRKPHLGVDFAAPYGTPVRAIGSGKVKWSAWKGAFGRHVEIDHGSGMISAYSHLSRIHPSARTGAHIERGQIIGYVGRTGRATGNHLHFAIFENGRYTNPLKARRSSPVANVDPGRFAAQHAVLSEQLRAMTTHHRPRRSAQPVALSSLNQAELLRPGALTF
ncbi:MAG: peptidoglycan DD-metalloendopeptidase family protein [Acidobacteriota bacterium]|jgi:murein DD-endopeptidase MepM/ murein hydrolase activator NlpD